MNEVGHETRDTAFHLHEVLTVVRVLQTERMVVARAWRESHRPVLAQDLLGTRLPGRRWARGETQAVSPSLWKNWSLV